MPILGTAASAPIVYGASAPSNRPELYPSPCPLARTDVGNSSDRNGPNMLQYACPANPSTGLSASNTVGLRTIRPYTATNTAAQVRIVANTRRRPKRSASGPNERYPMNAPA